MPKALPIQTSATMLARSAAAAANAAGTLTRSTAHHARGMATLGSGLGKPGTAFDERDLTDRVCLVTGANRGMGLELTKALAQRGARVIAVGRDTDAVKAAAESIEGTRHRVDGRTADCSDRHSIKALMQGVAADYGHIESLVLNASIMPGFHQPILDCPDELEEATFRTNVEGYWWCVKYGMPLLLAAPTDFERTVLFVSGLAGALEKPPPGLGMLVYSATLAAENGLMVRLHQEMVDGNKPAADLRGSSDAKDMLQRVVAVHPGIVATGLGRETLEGTLPELEAKKRSMGMITAEEGIDSLVWLLAAQDGVVQSGKFYDQRAVIPF